MHVHMSVIGRGRERRERKDGSAGGDVRQFWESDEPQLFLVTFSDVAKHYFSISIVCFKKVLLLDKRSLHLGAPLGLKDVRT